jgi:hypothetical protein
MQIQLGAAKIITLSFCANIFILHILILLLSRLLRGGHDIKLINDIIDMKRINFLKYTLVCVLFMCAVACDKDNPIAKESIPAVIKSDFSARFPVADISTFSKYPEFNSSEELWQIDFTDSDDNRASAWYKADGTWKMTHTKLKYIDNLSYEAKRTFMRSVYRDARIKELYKTEREGIAGTLYTLFFEFPAKTADDVVHYVFLNDDGLFLTKFTWFPNDPGCFVYLPKEHFDFISKKYRGAEIRGYVNNLGDHEYFVLHEGVIKYVFFEGSATERGFWKETRFELSKDTAVPDIVAQRLKKTDPDFSYTNLFYIEAERGNCYLFVDMNRDNELGYYIGENG